MHQPLVIARLGVVLDKSGGALAPIYNIAKYTKTVCNLAKGEGLVNWISLQDTIRFLQFSLENTMQKEVHNVVTDASLTFNKLNCIE